MKTNGKRSFAPARALVLSALLCLSAGSGLFAQTIRTTSAIGNITLNPNATVKKNGTIRVQSSGYIGTFSLVFTALSISPSPTPDGINYGLWKPSASPQYRLSLTGMAASADEVLQGNFPLGSPSNTRVTVDYAVILEAGTLPIPGTYVVSYRVDLYASGVPLLGSPVATKTLSFNVIVASRYDLSVVAAGAPFALGSTSASLAFGELLAGSTRAIDLIARTNVGYSISVSSSKGGGLAHIDPLEPSRVPYILRVDGSALALPAASPVPIVTGAPATGIAGRRYSLVFEIAAQASLPAEGSYSDTLSLSISAP